jgi:hypothetical protein
VQQIKNVKCLHTVFKIFWGNISLDLAGKRVGNTEILIVSFLLGGKRTEIQIEGFRA